MLTYTIKSFSCSKDGNLSEENEDASITPSFENFDGLFRVAIADGATESSFSKEWADLLVSYFYCFQFKNETFFDSVYPFIRRNWIDRVNANGLPWYAQQKLDLGSFASFLGVDINLENGICNIIAIGDSNFFVFRNGEMKLSFPVEKAEHFGNTPFLISTELQKNKTGGRFFSEETFELTANDIIILGTDAISHWILQQVENESSPVNAIYDLLMSADSSKLFENWLMEQRQSHLIKNDDTTIILIQFGNGTTKG